MGYRDDLSAAQARADALEQRVAELESENQRLREGDDEPQSPDDFGRRKRLALAAAILLGGAAVGVASLFGTVPLVIAGMFAGSFLAIAIVVASCAVTPRPGEILVISGRRTKTSDGRVVGYRVVLDGVVMKIPMIETVERLSVAPIGIDLSVQGAYSKGNVPLAIDGRASVKIRAHAPFVENAIERFLGKPPAEFGRVAAETIEGNLRGITAELTPEEIRRDRERFASYVIEQSDDDLRRLGLAIDTLYIDHVVDQRAES